MSSINTPPIPLASFYDRKIAPIIQYLSGLNTLRNKYILILFSFIIGVIIFFTSSIRTTMSLHPITTFVTLGVFAMFFLMYIYHFNYTSFFFLFLIVCSGFVLLTFILYNPYKLFPNLEALNVIFIVLFVLVIIILIASYDKADNLISNINFLKPYVQSIYTILSIIISFCFLILVYKSIDSFNKTSSQNDPGSYIINIFILLGLFGIVYKFLDNNKLLSLPIIRLITHSILYIPCLFTNVFDKFIKEYYQINNSILILLFVELIFILLYFAYPYFINKIFNNSNGTVIINKPIPLDKREIVSDYHTMNDEEISADKIKDASTVKMGNMVEVLQYPVIDASSNVININTANNTYDVMYTDNTYEYGVLKKNISTTGIIDKGSNIKCKKNWLVGTITNINSKSTDASDFSYENTYDISYNLWNNPSGVRPSATNIPQNRVRILNKIYPSNHKYKFSMSFWIYLNNNTSTTSNNSKFASLLNYGENPNVLYNSKTNELIITVLQNSDSLPNPLPTIEADTGTTYTKVYSNKNILLQRWNHFIINYENGILDIFYNGELAQSTNYIVPQLNFPNLKVGTDYGADAQICNLIYFKQPLTIVEVQRIYTISKLKDTPEIPNNLSLFSLHI